ncbi:MAG: hypothetical protein UY21_C0025G0006 [Microgenomates group bacterium GW2011_GWA1_48_10]|nr:MAG: hypothetical protein UY21_C0025G0006 [Microgenomates group bacterium GW2011_GWA1_48_10]
MPSLRELQERGQPLEKGTVLTLSAEGAQWIFNRDNQDLNRQTGQNSSPFAPGEQLRLLDELSYPPPRDVLLERVDGVGTKILLPTKADLFILSKTPASPP